MDIVFDVKNQILVRTDANNIVADSKNYLRAIFNFSSDWQGKTKTATFKSNNLVYSQILDESNSCDVPWEVINSGYMEVSVFGGDLITTNPVLVKIISSGYVQGETTKPPTPDVYTQILDKVSRIETGDVDYDKVKDIVKEEIDQFTVSNQELFNKTNYQRKYYLDNNGDVQFLAGGAWNVTNYIDISTNTDNKLYYDSIADNNSTSVASAFYDKDKNVISTFNQKSGKNIQEIPEGAAYLRMSFKEIYKNYASISIIGSQKYISETELDNHIYNENEDENIVINGYQQGLNGLAYTYWVSPQVIFDSYGYPADGSGGNYRNDQIFVGTVNKEGSAGVATININDESRCKNIAIDEVEVDLHDSSAIMMDNDNKLLVFTSKHGARDYIRIFKAKRTHDASSFRYVGRLKLPDVSTYSQVFNYNGMYHLFCRVTPYVWYWCKSTDLKNWDNTKIIGSDNQYYCLFKRTATEGLLRIIMLSHPNAQNAQGKESDRSIRQGFLNLKTGMIYNSDGVTELGLTGQNYKSFDAIITQASGISQRLIDVAEGTNVNDLRIFYTTFTTANDMAYKAYANGVITDLPLAGKALIENIKVPAGGAFAKNGNLLFLSRHKDNGDVIERYRYVTNTYELVKEEYFYSPIEENYRVCYLSVDKASKALIWTEGYYHNKQFYNWNPTIKFLLI